MVPAVPYQLRTQCSANSAWPKTVARLDITWLVLAFAAFGAACPCAEARPPTPEAGSGTTPLLCAVSKLKDITYAGSKNTPYSNIGIWAT